MCKKANERLRIQALLFQKFPVWTFLTLGILAFLSGCGTVSPHSSLSEELHLELKPKDYEFVKVVEGESCVGRYLFFLKFFTPNPLEAAGNAMRQAPQGNWLINRHVTVEEKIYLPLIYHRQCLRLEGEAIRIFKDGEEEAL